MHNTIEYNGQVYTLKFGFKAQYIYEASTGRAYSGKTTGDFSTLLFASLCAYNDNFKMSMDDEFFDMIDENPVILEDFEKIVEVWATDRERKIAEAKKK